MAKQTAQWSKQKAHGANHKAISSKRPSSSGNVWSPKGAALKIRIRIRLQARSRQHALHRLRNLEARGRRQRQRRRQGQRRLHRREHQGICHSRHQRRLPDLLHPLRLHLQVEVGPAFASATSFQLRDGAGSTINLLLIHDRGSSSTGQGMLTEERSPVYAVTDAARELVLYEGRDELCTVALELETAGVNVIRVD